MITIDKEVLTAALGRYRGKRAFLHFEFPQGGFVRNLAVQVEEVAVRGEDGLCRVALRCAGDGWVIMEGLTHMDSEEGQSLFLAAFENEAEQRLSRALQVSLAPFAS